MQRLKMVMSDNLKKNGPSGWSVLDAKDVPQEVQKVVQLLCVE